MMQIAGLKNILIIPLILNLIIGFLVGVVVFGIIWQFFLKNKQAEIDLAKSQVEIKAGEESKQELVDQLKLLF